jgi:menaquinone-dependent protoporphyrinogen oxidase
MARVLILYVTSEGHTGRIAGRIAERLHQAGVVVELQEVKDRLPRLDGYDGFVVGASVHYGHHPARLRALLRAQSAQLALRPSAFFSVCMSGKDHYRRKFLRQCGWAPPHQATFRGALQYSKYGPIKRQVMRGFATMMGRDTDPSNDYDYTDWKAVEEFSTAFAKRLP